jgi:hypothetical protein
VEFQQTSVERGSGVLALPCRILWFSSWSEGRPWDAVRSGYPCGKRMSVVVRSHGVWTVTRLGREQPWLTSYPCTSHETRRYPDRRSCVAGLL